MRYVTVFLILAAGIAAAYVRLAPSDADVWHADPMAAADPGAGGVLLLPGPDARTYAMTPAVLMTAFDAVAMAEPRTSRLAGQGADGHVTYVVRSRLLGFPDYVSVRAVAADGGAQLAVLSRLRFGSGDMGVNRARLDRWLAELEARAAG